MRINSIQSQNYNTFGIAQNVAQKQRNSISFGALRFDLGFENVHINKDCTLLKTLTEAMGPGDITKGKDILLGSEGYGVAVSVKRKLASLITTKEEWVSVYKNGEGKDTKTLVKDIVEAIKKVAED